MNPTPLRFAVRAVIGAGLCLSSAACGVDATDVDDLEEPTESTTSALTTAGAAESAGTATTTAAASSCSATHDGGKWCCGVIFGKLFCWKVPPPPPPDTIWTLQ